MCIVLLLNRKLRNPHDLGNTSHFELFPSRLEALLLLFLVENLLMVLDSLNRCLFRE